MLELYLEMLDLDYFEIQEAFKGLKDENVWRRPGEGLLSIGEIAGHIAYWEAARFAGGRKTGEHGMDLSACAVESPLLDNRHSYYDHSLAHDPGPEQLCMGAEQVCQELLRVHRETMAHLKALNPELSSQIPGLPPGNTFLESLKYTVFHVAYHTGQIYSCRHLLGEVTPDN